MVLGALEWRFTWMGETIRSWLLSPFLKTWNILISVLCVWMNRGSCKYNASRLLMSKQISWGHMMTILLYRYYSFSHLSNWVAPLTLLTDTPHLQTQHLTEWNIQYLTPLQHSLSTMDFRTNSANSLPFKGSKFMCGTGWHRLNYQAFQILLIQKDFPGSADRDLGSRQGWLYLRRILVVKVVKNHVL